MIFVLAVSVRSASSPQRVRAWRPAGPEFTITSGLAYTASELPRARDSSRGTGVQLAQAGRARWSGGREFALSFVAVLCCCFGWVWQCCSAFGFKVSAHMCRALQARPLDGMLPAEVPTCPLRLGSRKHVYAVDGAGADGCDVAETARAAAIGGGGGGGTTRVRPAPRGAQVADSCVAFACCR